MTSALGPQTCENGYYNPDTGRSECNFCPAGRICEGTDPVDFTVTAICDAGYYCPAQTNSIQNERIYCPAGYYGPFAGMGSPDECVICPAG